MWPWRRRSSADLDEEIATHIALEAKEIERERGVTAEQALREARRRFGRIAPVQDHFAESRGMQWATRYAQHLTYAARTLARRPGFTIAAAATLAIGIGFLTSAFTLYYGFLLRPVPLQDADRLVHIGQQWVEKGPREMSGGNVHYSWQDYLVYRDRVRPAGGALSSIAVYAPRRMAVAGADVEVDGELVSCEYFATTGARIIIGRAFAEDECAHPGAGDVAVLSHRLWTRQFGADSGVVGRTLRVNNVPLTIVGIAEPVFAGLQIQRAELWIPMTQIGALTHHRTEEIHTRPHAVWLKMIGRLEPGATPEQAREELRLAARALDESSANTEGRVVVQPVTFAPFRTSDGPPTMTAIMLFLLATAVAVMACINVLNLLLARAVARRREIGIRLAIGASRGRLLEQLVIESIVLALLGGIGGFALAHAVPAVVHAVSPIGELQVDLAPDATVLTFALGVALATSLLFGLVPALQATDVELTSAMRGTFALGTSRRWGGLRLARVRTGVIACQVAGSTLMLVLAGLLMRGALAMAASEPGIDPRNLVGMSLVLGRLGYTEQRARIVHDQIVERLSATPGVTSVASATWLPLGGGSSQRITPEPTPGATSSSLMLFYNYVSPAYLETIGLPLLRGRTFTEDEVNAGEPRPAVVSATAARRLWPETDPLGQLFRVSGRLHRVVGIADDLRAPTHGTMMLTIAYLPADNVLGASIVARTSGASAPVAAAVAEWARTLDPAIVVRTEFLEDRLDRMLAPSRITAGVAASLGGVALLLAVIGIYGVVSYATSQRRREVAVRMALGATRARVVALMMRQGAWATGLGLIIGLSLAWAAARGIRGMLYGVSPLDPVAYGGMVTVLVVATLTAMFIPSRRAAHAEPARELRDE